jgi:hypothetical protein
MTTIRAIQPSFSAGEISPALYARVDLAKYDAGLKRAKNVFIRPHGGVSNRAGLKFCCEVKNSANGARLIPFSFNTTQTYVLEFGNQYMRVITNGGQVLETGKTPTAITKANPGVMTIASHGYSNGDEVYISGVGGMTELNGRNFIVAGVTTNTFTLKDLYGTAIDTTSFTTFTSGGSWRENSCEYPRLISRIWPFASAR